MLLDQARDQQLQLLRRESDLRRSLAAIYADVWQTTRAELRELEQQIADAQARGEQVDTAWLYREQRLQRLQFLIARQLEDAALIAEGLIQSVQLELYRQGTADSLGLIQSALGSAPGVTLPLVTLPDAAVREIAQNLTENSPLHELLLSIAPTVSEQAARSLTSGVALGYGPDRIARELRDTLGIGLTRALTIARTETMRAYRQAALSTYRQNSDVVDEWIWHASLSSRTCAICWAMHGSTHPLSEPFGSHPNCRCTALPRTKSWEELGFSGLPDTRPVVRSGSELFAKLSTLEQEEVLGRGKFELYQAGRLQLADLVETHTTRWGLGRSEKPLKGITRT